MSQVGTRILAIIPGIVTGLFIGRLVSELWASQNDSTELWLAVVITLSTTLVSSWLLGRFSIRQTWPALFLSVYVFYPEPSFLVAGLVALFTCLTWWQVSEKRLSLQVPFADYLVPLFLLMFCFLLYFRTLAPDILPADNGEFQLMATNLGVAHPPGFPLYTLLAHLMTRIPLGPTPAYRVNLFSAVTSTLTLASVYSSVFIVTRRYLASIAAVLVLGTSTTFWAQATTANIRSMTALFASIIFLTLILFYRSFRTNVPRSEAERPDHYLALFALGLGLGITHHASLLFIGLVAIIFIILIDPALLRSPGRWWRPMLAFVIGLLPLLYLPVRANADVRGASPALATWTGFLEHTTAIGFRGDLFVYLEPVLLLERLKVMVNVLTFQFSIGIVLAMVMALILLLDQDWRLVFLFGGSALLFTFITATYRAPQTVEYMLPAYVALALLLGTAGGGVKSWRELSQNDIMVPLQYLLTAFVIVLAVAQLLSRYSSYSRLSDAFMARDYVASVLTNAPENALLLANWHWATPFWYLQEVEAVRPDVEVRYVFPEGKPYAQTWAERVIDGLADSRNVITTNYYDVTFGKLPVAEPLAKAYLFPQAPRTRLPDTFNQLESTLIETIQIEGFEINRRELPLGEELILTLAWKPVNMPDTSLTLFAHLVGADGRLAGQDDVPARARDKGVTLTQFHLTPFAGIRPGQFELQIGAYGQQPPASGEKRFPIASIQVLPSEFKPATQNPLNRVLLGNGDRRLVGFDRDMTLPDRPRLYLHWQTGDGYISEVFNQSVPILPSFTGPWGVLSDNWDTLTSAEPANYVPIGKGIAWSGNKPLFSDVMPGQELVLYQTFQSAVSINSDLVVSVRLIGFEEDGFHWAWWDLDNAIPAMGAIPTLKWINGSQVSSPHFVMVSESAQPAQEVGSALTLYDAFTGRPVPILDDRLVSEFGWIPLGRAIVASDEVINQEQKSR